LEYHYDINCIENLKENIYFDEKIDLFLNYAATASKKLSRAPVCPFTMDLPLFRVGNRTGIAQNAFGAAPIPV
jgi:hypothetical protein